MNDTHPEADKVQITLIREANTAKRIARLRSLSRTVVKLSRSAVKRANPDMSQQELDVLFVAYHYGEDLAARFRAYLIQDSE